MLSNWKTTIVGFVAGALVLAGAHYQSGMTFQAWATAIGIAVVGALAKDFNVTGGTTQQ